MWDVGSACESWDQNGSLTGELLGCWDDSPPPVPDQLESLAGTLAILDLLGSASSDRE